MPKILVTDDDERMLRLLSATLPPTYQIIQARDGDEAVVRSQKEMPDLVLLDVNMPGLNGFEVLRKLKSSPKLRGIHVIMVTARTDPADQALGMSLGADAYLVKPFSPLALLNQVNDLLGG